MKEMPQEQTEAAFLEKIGVKEDKIAELLKNKRIQKVVLGMAGAIESPQSLEDPQKKLVYKIVELASSPELAQKYAKLLLVGAIENETDLRNAKSVLEHQKDIEVAEVREQMEKNRPSAEELSRVAAEVVQENQNETKVKIIKELKHHPRLQFVPPKEILALLGELSITKSKIGTPEKKKTLEEVYNELLDLAAQPQPPTRIINKKYQQAVVAEELLCSKDKKWTRYLEGEMQTMHTPFTNYQKTPEILRQHLKRTKGQVRVRFPPEPNGHLHVGHAKAMSINFGYRDFYNGWISLRYDDTNPKAEKTEYYEKIKEMVEWMGYTPTEITYASDFFQRLYECAIELIKRGKAYVCHQSRKDFSESQKDLMTSRVNGEEVASEERVVSPWRERSIEENLAEFEKMKSGEYAEGAAVLRMKMDMSSNNPQLWDLVAYRVVKHPHPRTGDAWVIYPSYDFTHCLTDSFEDITHSFCTTEFINSRESYNWLCDALDVYRPVQWEYSRLCIVGALLSKRFITRAIAEKRFTGWDDPRLSTLEGLRSRGVPAFSIRRFVESLGITTAASEISVHQLDNIIREDLSDSQKTAAVLRPIKVQVPDGRIVVVDSKDYREGPHDANYHRIQRNATVMLKGIGKVVLDKTTPVITLAASEETPASAIPWLETTAPTALIEIIKGEEIVQFPNALVSAEAAKAPVNSYWQFLRIGYFIRVDSKHLHFRMVVPLKCSPLLE